MQNYRTSSTLLLACLALLLCAGPARAESAETVAFKAIKPDPPPKRLILNLHFLVSNEKHLHYFHKFLPQKKGGLYIGVGTDQNFVFAGWARPDRVVVVDFDQWVVDLFDIYAITFRKAKDPATFIDLWSAGKRKQLRGWIKEAWPDAARQKHMLKVFKTARRKVFARLKFLVKHHKKTKTPCFLNEQAQYDYIIKMFATGRWHAVRGDFKGKQTFTDIAAAAKKFGLVTRVFYLSNVEDYLAYTKQFKANMTGVPTDETSMTLRTSVHKYKKQYVWAYIPQLADEYKEWLALPGVRVLKQIVGGGKFKRNDLFHMKRKVDARARRLYGKKPRRGKRGKK